MWETRMRHSCAKIISNTKIKLKFTLVTSNLKKKKKKINVKITFLNILNLLL